MTTEQAEKRVLRWYGSMPAGDFYADVQAYREAIRAETAAPLEEALREAQYQLDGNIRWIHTGWHQTRGAPNVAFEDCTYPQCEFARRALSSPGGGDGA